MFARNLTVFAAVLLLSACSTTDDEGAIVTTDREGITTSASGDFVSAMVPNAAAGTQEDLNVNIGDRVFFGYDRYDLSSEGRDILAAQATWLQQYDSLYVTVEGHADERGTREYNLALGERRANSVKNYLVALGVSPSRINVISYGKERPAVPGSNESAWSQNRRGVTIVE